MTSLHAPTFGPSALTRNQNAFDRGVDAMADMLDWRPPSSKPDAAGFFATRERLTPGGHTRRVVFTGHFWMQDEPVAAWRQIADGDIAQKPFRPVSQVPQASDVIRPAARYPSVLMSHKGDLPQAKVATCFEELTLEPIDSQSSEELSTVARLASLELKVEVVRFSRPVDGASGVSSGRVVAVSENYSAQSVGGANVVIHENASLDRQLAPGEKVTMHYEGGKAVVYDGIAHDVNISASWMPKDQQAYLRMTMLDALSMMTAPQDDDDRLRDAMRYALESTAKFFGLSETKLKRADIQLVVNEKSTAIKAEGPESTRRSRQP